MGLKKIEFKFWRITLNLSSEELLFPQSLIIYNAVVPQGLTQIKWNASGVSRSMCYCGRQIAQGPVVAIPSQAEYSTFFSNEKVEEESGKNYNIKHKGYFLRLNRLEREGGKG